MALSDKNIVITPNIGSSNDPQIVFSGADASTAAQNITAKVYPTSNGTLSFEGSAGQLFSITNNFTGTIFSVNDVSGIPSIEVFDTGEVRLAQYNGFVSVLNSTQATSTSTGALRVLGGVGIGGDLYVGGAIYGVGSISGTVTTATNIAGGANRQIVVQTGAGATGFITAPSATGQVLSWNGSAFVWTTTIVATQVTTAAQTANASYFPTFVDANNAAAAAESVFTTSSFVINPGTGNIGIGTNAPEYGLHLGNNTAPKSLAFTIDNPTQADIIWKYIGQTKINAKIGSVGTGSFANKGLAFYTTDSLDTTTNAVERLRITESGNVGIGTTAPGYKLQVVGGGVHAQAIAANGSPDSYADAGAIMMSYASNTGSIRAYNNSSGTGTADIAFLTAGTERLRIDSAGNFFLTGGSAQLNTGFTNKVNISGAIVAGNATSTTGSILMQGFYGTGAITNFGTEYSSGGPVISYGVYPSNVGPGAFFSSSGAALTRGAYTIAGNQHNWYVGGAQTVAIGSAATLTLAMSLTSTGALAFNGAANYGTSGQVLQSNGNASPTWVNPSSLPASSAAQVNTILRTTSADHYLTFVDSNNASSTAELVYTSVNFSVNPSTGMVSAPTFSATSTTAGGFQGINADTALLPSFTWLGDLNTGMWHPAADTLAFTTGGSEKVRITDIGRLGVGLTAPGSILETEENTIGVTEIRITNSNTGANVTKGSRLTFRISDTVGTRKDVAYISAIAINQDSSNGDHLAFSTRTADATPTEKLRILNTGAISFGATGTAYGTSGQILQSNGNASPTWVAPSSLSAGSAESATYILSSDDRTKAPADDVAGRMRFGFTSFANNNTSPYADYLHLRSYTDASGGNDNLVMFRKDAIGIRVWQQAWGSSTAYATYKDVAFTDSSITGASAQVNTVLSTTNASHYLTFVDSNNSSAAAESVYTSANFVVNPSTGNVGVGTTTPQYKLDVNNGNASTFQASFGATFPSGSWTGIHFGYSEAANQLYRKSAIVFERTDAGGGGGNAAGKVHILNGPATGSGSATLSDARLTISELGNVGVGTTAPREKLDVTIPLRTEFAGSDNAAGDGIAIIGTGASRGLGIGSTIVFTVPANTDGTNFWSQARILGSGDNNSNGNAEGALLLQTRSLYNPGSGGSWNWRTGITIRASGAIAFGNGGTAYGTSGQLLQSNGNASPSWVNATGLTAGIAAQVNTIQQTTNAAYYLTFVDTNNATATAETVYTSANFVVNPSTGNVGINTTAPRSRLESVIGTVNTNADIPGTAATFVGPTGSGQGSQLSIESNDAIAANTGGVLAFGGRYSGTALATWAAIKGLKEDATAGNYGGYLSFYTRTNGAGYPERMRITPQGGISFGSSGTAYGTSGQLLQSAGNAAPTWVNQSSITAGSVPLTNTYVGFGSASNLLTGSSAFTWDATTLKIQGTTGFDSMVALNVVNGSNDFGRAQVRIVGRIQGGNDGWAIGGRANLIFAANAATSGATPGSTGVDKFALQYQMAADVLGFVSSTVNTSPILAMTQAGNVGVGTAAPLTNFEVSGSASTTVKVTSSGANTLFRGYGIGAGPTDATVYASMQLQPNSGEVQFIAGYSGWGGYQTFYTNGAERLRITTTGGISFGSSGTAYGTSGQILQSNGNASPTWVNASGISAGSATSSLYTRVLQQTDGTTYNTPTDPRAASGGRGNNLNANQYAYGLFSEFKNSSLFSFTGNYTGLLTYANWVGTAASTGDPTYQLAFHPNSANATANPRLKFRAGIDTTWGAWGEVSHTGVIDLNIRHNSIGLNQAAPGTAGAIAAPIQFVNRSSFPASGISWYSSGYTTWSTYMALAGTAGQGPTANITPSAGAYVTTWALRNTVENVGGYGFTWESATSSGAPAVIAELRSSDGLFHAYGNIYKYNSPSGGYMVPAISISDAVPSGTVSSGDLWWESDTGRLKIYYNDGSSSQWVDVVPVVDTSLFFSKAGGAISGPVSINGALDVTGNINATGEITAYYSDRRLKTDVVSIENALVKVKSLHGVTYRPNELAKSFGLDTDSDVVGLFADEVEQVLPQAVKPAPFDIDEDGNSKSGEHYKTIQYEKVVPLLVEAIKEQQAIIDAQQAKIDRLMKHLGLED